MCLAILCTTTKFSGCTAASVHSVNVSGSISVGLFLHQSRSLLPYAGHFSGNRALGQRQLACLLQALQEQAAEFQTGLFFGI